MFGFLLASLAAFQQFKLPPMLPEMLATYDYQPTLAGGFMSIYAAIGLVATLVIGRLMQRYGAILLLAAGFGLALTGNAVALALPGDGYVMLGARALEGLAFAVFAVAGPVYTSRNAAPQHLPLAIALSAIWIPVGQLAANVLVPLAEITIGWRFLWLATAGATLSLGFWAISIQTSGRASLDLKQPPAAPGSTPIRITGWEWAALILGASLFTLWSAQYFAYMTWLPQFLVDRHGLAPNLATLAYSVPVAILIVFGMVTSWALRKGVPVALMLVTSMALQAGVWYALPVTDTVERGAISLVLYGIGIGFTPVCLFALPSTILGSKRAGPNAFAVLMTGRNMGVLIGPMLLPQVLIWSGKWETSGIVFGTITALSSIGAVVLAILLLKLGRSRPD
jgi:MFS family permease